MAERLVANQSPSEQSVKWWSVYLNCCLLQRLTAGCHRLLAQNYITVRRYLTLRLPRPHGNPALPLLFIGEPNFRHISVGVVTSESTQSVITSGHVCVCFHCWNYGSHFTSDQCYRDDAMTLPTWRHGIIVWQHQLAFLGCTESACTMQNVK